MRSNFVFLFFVFVNATVFSDARDCLEQLELLKANPPNLNEFVFHSRCKTGQMLEIQKLSELKYGSNTTFLERVLAVTSPKGIVEGRALDLGSGTGVWTKYLLKQGNWHVHALDFFQPSLDALAQSVSQDARAKLSLHNADFRSFTNPEKFDLIVANNSLCFVPREDLPNVVENLFSQLKPGGILAATFWGDQDIRGEDLSLSTFTPQEVRKLFEDKFTIISCCNSEEGIAPNLDNELVPWQVVYTIVQKPS